MDDSMDFIPNNMHNEPACSSINQNCGHSQRQSTSFHGSTPLLNPNILEATEFNDDLHAGIVLANLSEFRDRKFMCDVEIEVESQVFAAHRYVLAAAIPYFRSMFASDMLEARQKRIVIQDLPVAAFKELLNYAYTSKIRIDGENVQELLYAALILQMDAVCGACQKFLTQYLTTSNCLSIRHFAEQHNCVSLMSSVDEFTMEHFPELRRFHEFLQIPSGHLIDLLESSDLKVNNEMELSLFSLVFETVMQWVDENVSERKQLLPELLNHVRLPELPVVYLLKVVRQHALITESSKCREIVADAIAEMMQSRIANSLSSKKSFFIQHTVADDTNVALATDKRSPILFFPMDSNRLDGNVQSDVINMSTKHENTWGNCRPRKSAAGVVFCVGGRGTSGDPFRSVEAYDWRKNKWFTVSDMNTRRRHVGVVSALGKLYAIGGHDGSNHLDSAECFDPAINMWHNVAAMETCRRGIAVGALEGAIYAVGGLDDTACFQTVERYDIEADKWSSVASMNVQRGGVGVAALERYLFAVGGNDGTSSLDSCERYDPILNKWVLVANMQHRRAGAGVTVLNGCLYAIGGFDDNAPLSSCERYDPFLDKWELLSQMSCPRGGVGVAAMGGRIYAIGGHDGIRYLNSVEAYDPHSNQWFPVAAISTCRAGAGVAWADCHVDMLLRPPSMAQGKDSGCAPCITGVAHCV